MPILTPAGVTSGPFANARFTVSTSCDIFRCQENGSVDQNVRFDDLFLHHGPIIIHHDFIDIHPPKFHPPEFDFHIPDLESIKFWMIEVACESWYKSF